ncbi:MAG: GNAT family N-acetyltransferase, partial [Cyclobacteriaceae bacterium]|nr:GNAT family N-acetyltransferase [Cyclobacteriaceae bacterium]
MNPLRVMVQEDIPAGLALCRAAGWNQRAAEWELFLTLSPQDCRVAFDSEGNVVGTVTTVGYEDHFSWIGMLLVDPAQQRHGIGTQLLQESLNILREAETVKLDATPQGREVYLKLDFVDEYSLSRMKASRVAASILSEGQARPIMESDFHRLLEFDREVFGADREAVLRWLWYEAAQYAFIT